MHLAGLSICCLFVVHGVQKLLSNLVMTERVTLYIGVRHKWYERPVRAYAACEMCDMALRRLGMQWYD